MKEKNSPKKNLGFLRCGALNKYSLDKLTISDQCLPETHRCLNTHQFYLKNEMKNTTDTSELFFSLWWPQGRVDGEKEGGDFFFRIGRVK